MTNEPEEKGEGKKQTPLRAIRAKCLDCVLGSSNEVQLCPMENKCALWPFRFGKNPNVKLSDEERERRSRMARENLAFTLRVKDTTFEGVEGANNGTKAGEQENVLRGTAGEL